VASKERFCVPAKETGNPADNQSSHRDTIDEDVMLRRETKREGPDILLDAMKRKGVR
jgi:hypothetical protein